MPTGLSHSLLILATIQGLLYMWVQGTVQRGGASSRLLGFGDGSEKVPTEYVGGVLASFMST